LDSFNEPTEEQTPLELRWFPDIGQFGIVRIIMRVDLDVIREGDGAVKRMT